MCQDHTAFESDRGQAGLLQSDLGLLGEERAFLRAHGLRQEVPPNLPPSLMACCGYSFRPQGSSNGVLYPPKEGIALKAKAGQG